MYGQVIPRLFLWLVSLCAALTIGIIGCGGDGGDGDDGGDTDWVGTWSLESVDGTNIRQQLDQFEQLAGVFGQVLKITFADDWTFDDDGTWHRETAYEVDEGDGPEASSFEGWGTYSLSGSDYSLTVTEVTGEVETDAIDIELHFEDLANGTWSISGDTLTLTGDGGSTVSLKKK